MTKRTRFFGALAGAIALLALTYGVTRRSAQRRLAGGSSTRPDSSLRSAQPERVSAATTLPNGVHTRRAWAEVESLDDEYRTGYAQSDSSDANLDLDGIFDAESGTEAELTARPADRIPHLFVGDDEEAPSPEDMARVWISQATESERSLSEADLSPEIDELAALDELDDPSPGDSEVVSDDPARDHSDALGKRG